MEVFSLTMTWSQEKYAPKYKFLRPYKTTKKEKEGKKREKKRKKRENKLSCKKNHYRKLIALFIFLSLKL
jgi:hypothetical protein